MGFFDLNVPYTADKPGLVKIVAKTLELGYDGAAFNRSFSGVLSDHDRCSIVPLRSLDSLLKAAPSLSSSASFHRSLLDVRPSYSDSNFRQYTRLTVHAENVAHAHTLNAGNHVVKSYDLVAVRPLSQAVFDVACEKAEVDIISIDFTEKLSFRIKLPAVKAAIKRGVYFEITYSSLIKDVHVRRQFISSAKILVEWTRGRNLIISSGASSVNHVRGPYDVANLMSLIGISMEHAKASISKNCRTLLANALRKKKFYKETIRVEKVTSEKVALSDWLNWDPISSGDGDLPLEDLKKSFSISDAKSTKRVNFSSVMDDLSSCAFSVKDLVSGDAAVPLLSEEGRNLLDTTDVVGQDVAFKSPLVACSSSKYEATAPSPANPDDKGSEAFCAEPLLTSDHQIPQGDMLLTRCEVASEDQMEVDTIDLNVSPPEEVTVADATFLSSNMESGQASSSAVLIEEDSRLIQSDFDNEQQHEEKPDDTVSDAVVSNSNCLNSGGDMVLPSPGDVIEIIPKDAMKFDGAPANPELPGELAEVDVTVPSSRQDEWGRATIVSCCDIASPEEALENAYQRPSTFRIASLSEGGVSKIDCLGKLVKHSACPELSEEASGPPSLINGEVNENPANLAFSQELTLGNDRTCNGQNHKLTANLMSQGEGNQRLKRRAHHRPTAIPFKRLMSPVFFKRKARPRR
ncbi:hypothetical protein MLD38_014431 [Melastoma candidum]|uniref:Uncharacterized protein n=1 Tax=Melastoma candidum TaxID=119954 RepID=A0ACB9RE35_9MYRT|nr:hypothetical protein MLD38_014431 [Melastoma candidum]